ncbi:MAG TPA: glutamate-5-semialdehyde dehydrogenase [Bacteroidales bacterium]|nr:glutamate-5-semialdehyde dehydrogenase [Bacteroidales bacterium]
MDCTPVFRKVARSSRVLRTISDSVISKALITISEKIVEAIPVIIEANKKDLSRMDKDDPRYDRLLLSPERIISISSDIRNVVSMPDPTGRTLSEKSLPNGLLISRTSVPFGVIGVIFEARPNVVIDVFSLCLKSRNACVLKGGTDARDSNEALVTIIKESLKAAGIDEEVLALLPPGREETIQLLNAREYIDLVIPRGSRGLIDFVRENARVPVIETGAGICHTYFDRAGDRDKGRVIVNNAKTRRVSVCNALDCLVIHRERLSDLWYLVELCASSSVIIFADEDSYEALREKYPEELLKHADRDSFGTEFLSYKMAVKTVASIEEAMDHIEQFGSKHSEAIISEDINSVNLFLITVDASAVYANTSTAFTDGSEFGLGAEIGISTQKLHARGPMALEELTTYKWIIRGNGQIRK